MRARMKLKQMKFACCCRKQKENQEELNLPHSVHRARFSALGDSSWIPLSRHWTVVPIASALCSPWLAPRLLSVLSPSTDSIGYVHCYQVPRTSQKTDKTFVGISLQRASSYAGLCLRRCACTQANCARVKPACVPSCENFIFCVPSCENLIMREFHFLCAFMRESNLDHDTFASQRRLQAGNSRTR